MPRNRNSNNNHHNGLPPPRRKNGFSRPFGKSQISAWIALVATYVEFMVFIMPVLPLAAAVPVTVLFTAFVMGILYYGGLTQLVDPIDVHLQHHYFVRDKQQQQQQQQNANNNGNKDDNDTATQQQQQQRLEHQQAQQQLPQEEMKQCWICDTQVAEHSMHCKFCNKCVYHFDHHCMCKL